MAGGTKIERKARAEEDDYKSSKVSRASTARRKKKKSSSVASTAASTSSSVKRRAGKRKAMKKADNLMSDLIGMTDHSSDTKKQQGRKYVPKKINSRKSLDEHLSRKSEDKSVLDDGVSCLTDNSKSTKGTRSKKKKKRSSSKKPKKSAGNDESREQYSPTDKSVTSRRSKSRSKKRAKNIASPNSTQDNGRSVSKKSENSNHLSKLHKRDRLYHTKSNNSMVASVTSPYHSRDDDSSRRGVRRTKSLPIDAQPSTPSSRSSSKKKENKFGKDGNVRLKILADGTVKASVPRRSKSFDKKNIMVANPIDEGSDSDSDSVSLSDSSDDERYMKTSLQQVREMGIVTKLSSDTESSSVKTSSRRRPPPVRMAARGNSSIVRSASADHVREMQRHLVRSTSTQSFQNSRNTGNPNAKNVRLYVAPSPREAPLRRGVNRNSSAPLRSAMRSPSYSGRAPHKQRPTLRTTKSAYLLQSQRRPPERRTSKELSTAEHIQMLRGLTLGKSLNRGPSQRSFDNNSQRRRSSSQPPDDLDDMVSRRGRRVSKAARSLSPKRGMLRSMSQRSDCSFSSTGSMGPRSMMKHLELSKSDLDPGDLEGSMALNHDLGGYGSEHETLNDSRHVIGIDTRDISKMSRTRSRKLSRSSSENSLFGMSTHSLQSNRSQMSIDKPEPFENDPKWKAALRYIYLLPPYRNESKLKKKIRHFTWISMLLDFIAATVAVVQYQGSALCCGEPIYDVIMDINWDVLFRVVTYMYMCMIVAEIVPVIKNGIPFNIVNPGIGLIITFGMFFDDSIAEAVAMWVIEALAIFFEFMVYRVNARVFFETSFKLNQVDEEIEELKKKRKEFVEMLQGGSGSMHGSRHGGSIHRNGSRHSGSQGSWHAMTHRSRDGSRNNPFGDEEMGRRSRSPSLYDDDDDDDDSLSGHSFGGDEDFYDEGIKSSNPPPRVEQIRRPRISRTKSRDVLGASTHSNGASTTVTGITGVTGGRIRLPGEIKQNKLLRRRRILRENKKAESKELHYHFIGSVLNTSLAVIAMIFIITIASTGGLCFKGDNAKVFSFKQLEICDMIDTSQEKDSYEECGLPEGNQCYLPYY
eukprot:CAMPEP_0116153474 /NCGR_PEP_ID=MMETSP0329-20121206/21266_1 /TAXON_ID=697910 /ORGANISM="Pseudo-nitzschia arenysensis, Strain B593" /LENGTH=1088 /DNA_ID=CAMNT_0003650389 /DNA_START=349 /DNA_END=3615 /DNA_ORIENTATION=+